MVISDMQGREVMRLVKPFNCCVQELEVLEVTGSVIGSVSQQWWPCLPKFQIKNEFGETVLTVAGPCSCLQCSCGGDIVFTLTSQDTGLEVFIETFPHNYEYL